MIKKSTFEDLIENPEKISDLPFEDIKNIINRAKRLFRDEEFLIELTADKDKDIFVIGDIHGNLDSLLKIYELVNEKGPEYVIFLGDIVDRGGDQLECLIFVLSLKILYPQQYFLLKGNHETLEMNKSYGFYNEFMMKFSEKSQFDEVNSLYESLPICAIINDSILCLHGGIPEDFNILNELKELDTKKLDGTIPASLQFAMYQMMWNDPKEGLTGFMDNFRGPGIKYYGYEAFEEFMDKNGLKYCIRAHEVFPQGYKWFFNNRLLSIFSSENYRGDYNPNPATYALIRDNMVSGEIVE
jgi:diadenosine tetraphosphatase ApaH/serine/threonine PP2A family protein phosphatase